MQPNLQPLTNRMFTTVKLAILLIYANLAVAVFSNSPMFAAPRTLFETFLPMSTYSTLEFPKWLKDLTGMTDWPGADPPYIPMDFIDFTKVPDVVQHNQDQCDAIRGQCSFDCFHCVTSDEVYTCPQLTQTFDDGPSLYTLNLLNKLRQPVTFFTLGINVVKYPEIYKLSMSKGHVMGSHTWSHKYLPSLSNEQIVSQIQWSVWAMNVTGNHLPKWFRPPYGGLDNRVRAIVRQFGMQSVLWNFDTFDWKLLLEDGKAARHELQIFSDLKKFQKLNKNQGILLEHDHSLKTVEVAIKIDKQVLNHKQMTVPQCVGGIDYIRKFEN